MPDADLHRVFSQCQYCKKFLVVLKFWSECILLRTKFTLMQVVLCWCWQLCPSSTSSRLPERWQRAWKGVALRNHISGWTDRKSSTKNCLICINIYLLMQTFAVIVAKWLAEFEKRFLRKKWTKNPRARAAWTKEKETWNLGDIKYLRTGIILFIFLQFSVSAALSCFPSLLLCTSVHVLHRTTDATYHPFPTHITHTHSYSLLWSLIHVLQFIFFLCAHSSPHSLSHQLPS